MSRRLIAQKQTHPCNSKHIKTSLLYICAILLHGSLIAGHMLFTITTPFRHYNNYEAYLSK